MGVGGRWTGSARRPCKLPAGRAGRPGLGKHNFEAPWSPLLFFLISPKDFLLKSIYNFLKIVY